ncbi:MAG TPA: orotate phosphoribosyltransferase [Cytophagaceae bacterium]|jgi:orotate phosphoribosyltransferase
MVSSQIAALLLEVGAVKLNPQTPFKWASGWNSPIYCDNRLTLSFPDARSFIKNALAEIILAKFPNVEAIAGVATAGVPQGALVADLLNKPFVYVRPKPKDHGMTNLIEGKVEKGQKIVVIEDLISTGGSSIKAVEALRDAGVEVVGMAAIFTYGFKIADENFAKANVKLVTLSNYFSLLEEGLRGRYITDDQVNSLKEWREKPETWTT